MPKNVDYAARRDAIGEAVQTVVLRDGLPALTVGAIAAELNLSVDSLRRSVAGTPMMVLACLAQIERRRRTGFLRVHAECRRVSAPWQRRLGLLELELPTTPGSVDDERAWAMLTAAFGRQDQRIEDLAREFDEGLGALIGNLAEDLAPADPEVVLRLRLLVAGLRHELVIGRLSGEDAARLLRDHVQQLAASSDQRLTLVSDR